MNTERDADTDERHEVHQRVDETVLEQLRQRVDIGGHAGHDPARHLVLVVVDAEALEVREDLDAERMEHAFRRAAHHAGFGPHQVPVDEHDHEEHERRGPHRVRVLRRGRDASVDAEPHEDRPGEGAHRVERDEQQADEQPVAVAPQEVQELEIGRRSALRLDVDVRVGGRGPQRVDLGEQLRRRCERAAPRAAGTHAATTSSSASRDAHRGGRARGARALGDLRAADLLVVETPPGRGRDAVDLFRVERRREGLVALGVATRTREQHAVERAARPQRLVGPRVEHAPLVDHHDAVGQRQRRPPVCDEDRRTRAGDPAQRRVDLLLDP